MKKLWDRLRSDVVSSIMLLMLAILVSGCSTETILPKDESHMTQTEEKTAKEKVIQYVKRTYQKNFIITDIDKDHVMGGYYDIHGFVQDGKEKTTFMVTWTPPNDFRDSYALAKWSNELEPWMKETAQKTMDLWKMENMTYGYKDNVENKYTGDVPSVFEILKRGDKDLSLVVSFNIYDHRGQSQAQISKFLNELKKMNFNEVIIEIFVYDDKLKTASKNIDTDKYAIYRYNISGDIQKIDINNLDQYKTDLR